MFRWRSLLLSEQNVQIKFTWLIVERTLVHLVKLFTQQVFFNGSKWILWQWKFTFHHFSLTNDWLQSDTWYTCQSHKLTKLFGMVYNRQFRKCWWFRWRSLLFSKNVRNQIKWLNSKRNLVHLLNKSALITCF